MHNVKTDLVFYLKNIVNFCELPVAITYLYEYNNTSRPTYMYLLTCEIPEIFLLNT